MPLLEKGTGRVIVDGCNGNRGMIPFNYTFELRRMVQF